MDESITKSTLNVDVNDKEDYVTQNEVEDDKKSVQLNNKKKSQQFLIAGNILLRLGLVMTERGGQVIIGATKNT